jgi:hypothetical protein
LALDTMRMDPCKRNFVVDVIPNHDVLSSRTSLLKDASKYVASADYAVRISFSSSSYSSSFLSLLSLCQYNHTHIHSIFSLSAASSRN